MRNILQIYLDKIYSLEKRREEVFFDENYDSLLDITSYGHDIESSWLIEWGTSLLEDENLLSRVSSASSIEGFLNEYRKSGDEKYLDAALSIWEYIKEHFADRRSGSEWFWAVGEDDKPVFSYPIADPWKCPYHNGRLCLNLMREGVENGL